MSMAFCLLKMDQNEEMVQTAFECISTGLEAYLDRASTMLMNALM